ncbi:MAG: DUF4097 family beta strand repeat protein [Gammaproteobacteria bacterium]|nr:DUF4097 family beta strand repeat protein [Gammaproteobacteria bacterium]
MSAGVAAGESIDKTLPVQSDGKVSISIVRGDVEVSAWDKLEVRVTGELDEKAGKFIFENSGSETTIKVELEDDSWGRNWNSGDTELTIYVPRASSIDCGGVSTDFKITGLQGGVSANSVSGDIEIAKVAKYMSIETVSGDVNVKDSQGKMKLSSVSGDVTVDGAARQFKVTTVSGDLEADLELTEYMDLSSVSGDLDVEFEFAEDGEIEAGTVSGDIILVFHNGQVNARFNLETGPGGDIENDITKDRPDSSFIGAETLKFKSGNGKGSVDLETMSGSLVISN